jgi:tetratricopeptide (TPR) repeat protein
MKRLFTALFFINFLCCVYGQSKKIDSLKHLLSISQSNTSTVLLRASLAQCYVYNRPDSSFILAKSALYLAKSINYEEGEARCYKQIGEALQEMGNYPGAMDAYLTHLRLSEKLDMQFSVAEALINIGLIYEDQAEYRQAINYTLKANTVIDGIQDKKIENYDLTKDVILINAGYGYYLVNQLDSALDYEQQAYELALKIHNIDNMGDILQNLGLIQDRLNNKPLAITYLRMSVQSSENTSDSTTLTDTYMSIARFFNASKNTDSTIFYAKKALATAKASLYIKGVLDASNILSNIYGSTDKTLAYDYLKTATIAKDSLFNQEKVKQVQNLKFEEQVREQEIAELKTQQEEDRHYNLQLSLIALFIPVFFLVALLLSKTKVHYRVIEFMSVLAILFLFEFVTLLLHPLIGEFTNHTPIVEFLIFVCFAAIMVPMHHRLTHWLKERLSHVHKWGAHHEPEPAKSKEITGEV